MLSGDRKTGSSVLVDASIARQMSDMIRGFRTSQVVGTIARLGIPDRLVNGARSAGELEHVSPKLNRWGSMGFTGRSG